MIARRQRCARIIMYHGIPEKHAAGFRAQMHYFVRNFRVISLGKMVWDLVKRGDPGPPKIVLTFDDGLRNNLTVVYPVLRELSIPATFFVCPGLLEDGRWLWNHEARCRLQTLSEAQFAAFTAHLGLACGSVENAVEWMKTLPNAQRVRAEQLIRRSTRGFVPTHEQRQTYEIMDWEQLRSLDPRLVTIGSHTLTHPILTGLDDHQIELELVESRRLLEQRLQRPVEYFCYPNGSHDQRVQRAVARHYAAAVTTESGIVGERDHDLHLLPRIPGADDLAVMAWRLHRPGA